MKAIIYNRTSSKDQHPELQIHDCEKYCKEKGWEIIDRLEEKESAFKDESKRKVFQSMIERGKKREFQHIVVWNMDRFSRQKEEDVLDLVKILSTMHNVRVHAVNGDAWSEVVETIGKLEEMGFIGKALSEFLETLLRGLEFQRAYRESLVKSERVKLATRKKDNTTYSYKGNKWGRKPMSKQAITKILNLHKEGLSMRAIASEVTYTGKNNKVKNVSLAVVHKIVTENKENSRINKLDESAVHQSNK